MKRPLLAFKFFGVVFLVAGLFNPNVVRDDSIYPTDSMNLFHTAHMSKTSDLVIKLEQSLYDANLALWDNGVRECFNSGYLLALHCPTAVSSNLA